MVKQELSEYEQQRQANIAERDALLKKLALDAPVVNLTKKLSHQPSTTKPNRKKPLPKRIKEEVTPRRTSSRLAGIEADSAKAKRKAEQEYEVAKEVERVKRQRVSGDLELKDVIVSGKQWGNGGFLVDVVNRSAQPYVKTFSDTEVKATSDKELKALREKMNGLELYEGFEPNRIKITPERIYTMTFHPEPSKAIVFAGDKMGNLGVFDASQKQSAAGAGNTGEDEDEDDEPIVTSFHLHTRTISSLVFSPINAAHLLSASYDSSVRLLDLATAKSTEIYGPVDKEADEPLSGLDIDPLSPHVIIFSRLDGSVGRHDSRAKSSETSVWELSEKKIGGFSLHPNHSHFLATASLDRTMKLWDLRKMAKSPGGAKIPTCLGEHTSRLSVSHAAFNGVGQIATSSYDDTIKLYSFTGMDKWEVGGTLDEKAMEPSATIKHNNQTGRWVTILRPQWQRAPKDGHQRFVIGNMNRFVDVYSGNGRQLAQLGGDGISAVPAVAQFHPTQDWIAAGTASGKLCLWM